MSIVREYTAFFAFCGSGGGAYGFQQAEARLFGERARIRVIGGFDIDPKACANFEYLTGVKAVCCDVRDLTPEKLMAMTGGVVPDIVFGSPPCVGATKLITDELAETAKYVELNKLPGVWTKLMLETWGRTKDRRGVRLVLFENVPNIVHRAKKTIAGVRRQFRAGGMLVNDEAHELGEYGPPDAGGSFYDAGALGGLAQRRKRWLLSARDPDGCSALLFKPVQRRVRGVGEVIGPLPMPDDLAGGPMHKLPRLSVMNLIRLALIPAGGDHRDLPGVLEQEQQRREVHRRTHVARWGEPSVTVGGPGSNGPVAVADPRLNLGASAHTNILHIAPWGGSARAVTGAPRPSNGATSVADPRLTCEPHAGAYGVTGWGQSASLITGAGCIDNANQAVADVRVKGFRGVLGVMQWGEPSDVVTGRSRAMNGPFNLADIRVKRAFDKGYSVIGWKEWANTVAGISQVGCGAYAVADPRPGTPHGWLTVDDVMVFLETPGPWAIVDRSSDGPPLAIITDLRKPPPIPLRIVARDGTWHRPLTVLELAILQGLPFLHHDKPLQFTGPATADRVHIGNLVPPPAAMAIAERMLTALLQHDLGGFALSGGGGVWVLPEEGLALQ